jgi:flagellar assembly factor FliW
MKHFITYLIALFSIITMTQVNASAFPTSEQSFENLNAPLICNEDEKKKKKEGEGEADDEEPECD